ncbi:cytochrome P450 CYP12A2-like [Uranotaenia lowii]|uniref:cytochrome P450 CYP12A2-like n=1 Tax=Uranotaenia lowii TaxID=190385 RepID=UPI00247ADCBD|nr:cytochrome P450 CYP12A2-like [Uranotaenia lowii]
MIRNAFPRKALQLVPVRLFNNHPQQVAASSSSGETDLEWANAQPYESIPGPGSLQMMRNFAPGGRYYNKTMPDIMQALRDDYGDLWRLPGIFGRRDMVATFKPDDFEKILRTEGQWPIRRGFDSLAFYREKVRPEIFKGMGLVTEQGEGWHHFRTIVNPVMLQPKTVQLYIDKLDEVAQDFMKIIPNLRDAKNEMPADFNQWINRWALEVMGVLALDTRLGVLEHDQPEEASELMRLIGEFLELSYQLDILPSVWKYYKTPTFNRFITVLDGITDIITSKIDAAMIRLEKNPSKSSDTMSVLEKLLKVDRDVAIIMAFDMLQAGVDTTSSGMIGILHALATNSEKQNKLRKEIRAILPSKNSPLTPDNMRNLPYLRACIKEGLRVQSPIVGGARTSGKDLVLQGYRIPKETDIMMPAMSLYKDERHFARAQKFLPERWLKQSEPGVPSAKSAHSFLFLPFGFGPRSCIGRRLAMMEIEIFLARVTRQFEYRWNHGPLKIRTSLINVPTNELRFEMTEVVD